MELVVAWLLALLSKDLLPMKVPVPSSVLLPLSMMSSTFLEEPILLGAMYLGSFVMMSSFLIHQARVSVIWNVLRKKTSKAKDLECKTPIATTYYPSRRTVLSTATPPQHLQGSAFWSLVYPSKGQRMPKGHKG